MFELEYDERLELCIEQMSLDYNISEKTAKSIIFDMGLEDVVFDFYSEIIAEVEKEKGERLEREAELERATYNDGWSDHEGV